MGGLPLLGRLSNLLQTTTGLLQLSQRVRRGQRGHCRVLDEWVSWVVRTEVTIAPAPTPGVWPAWGGLRGIRTVHLLEALVTVKVELRIIGTETAVLSQIYTTAGRLAYQRTYSN